MPADVHHELAEADAEEILEQAHHQLATEIAGLDALEEEPEPEHAFLARAWSVVWPKLAAIALAIFAWQAVVWTGWRKEFILPSPFTVLDVFWHSLFEGATWEAIATTMRRAVTGFSIALIIGTVLGLAVCTFNVVRRAVGSLITGLQTMPSVAWFPLALVLFKLSEGAIFFVIVLGAAPSIANGLINGVDHIPPLLLRAGRVLGTNRLTQLRHVVVPAALPSFVGGLKQGWAFAWRSLLAGELLVIVANKPSIGSRLDFDRQFSDYPSMMAMMLVILIIGILIDGLVFTQLDRTIRRRRGVLA